MNTLPAGSILFEEQQEATQVGVVLKGKVEAYNKGMRAVFGVGTFIGVADSLTGSFQATWRVIEEASVFVFPVSEKDDIDKILKVNKDYPGLMVYSVARQMLQLWTLRQELLEKADQIQDILNDAYRISKEQASRIGQEFKVSPLLESGKKVVREMSVDEKLLQSHLEVAAIPANVQKAYYGATVSMAYRHVLECASLLNKIQNECQKAGTYLGSMLAAAAGSGDCLLGSMNQLGASIVAAGGRRQEIDSLYGKIEKEVQELAEWLKGKTGLPVQFDEAHWEDLRRQQEENTQSGEGVAESVKDIMDAVEDSLDKLLVYGGLAEDKANMFRECLRVFLTLKDRFSTEDAVRRLRKTMADLFYELYEQVFLRRYQEKGENCLADMFLNYGFLSEKLLEKNQVVQLYHLAGAASAVGEEGELPVYTAKEWLSAIYEQKKDPSKNEFDMDFHEHLRDMKKSTHMSPEEERAYLSDSGKRLEFEIKNMFRSNSRLVCGQISSFVPFLFQEQIPGELSRYCQSKEAVRMAVRQLEELDYSIFYREVLYVNEEKGIKKEYIQKKVYPDVILLPVAGSRGSMWQDISGRKRDSAGRFLFPILSDTELKEMMIPIFGRFHWELCRTIQGTAWNDIKVKSLTSEYSDYIQFYRKNKDLSEERKEKVKAQIQKARNNTREVFVSDYEIWMKFESQGAMRLNKVAREILAMYCPFEQEIRVNLAKQGIYDEAMARFHRETFRKQKEFEMRLRHIENENGEITQELQDTLAYYREH